MCASYEYELYMCFDLCHAIFTEVYAMYFCDLCGVEDIDLRVTRQEGPGYSYGRCQKPGDKLEDDGPEMG